MILLRHELGEVLRERRQDQSRTLRDVAASASVSLGYLSEIERGVKEASSELLAAVCDALDVPMSVVIDDVSRRIAHVESLSAPVALPVGDRAVVSASAA